MSNVVQSQMPGDQAHRPKTGETLRAPNMAKSYDTVRDLSWSIGAGDDQQIETTLDGNTRLLGIIAYGPTPGDGIVVCKGLQDVQTTPQEYQVLLPSTFYELTRGSRVFTYVSAQQRTANDQVNPPETQYLIPELLIGDVLMCVYNSGVWQDLNIDGRQWVADPPP